MGVVNSWDRIIEYIKLPSKYCWWFRNPAPVEVGNLSHHLHGFIHPRWCKISSINSSITHHQSAHQFPWVSLTDSTTRRTCAASLRTDSLGLGSGTVASKGSSPGFSWVDSGLPNHFPIWRVVIWPCSYVQLRRWASILRNPRFFGGGKTIPIFRWSMRYSVWKLQKKLDKRNHFC